ncbi:MAG: NAD-dependent epimerase/dehydratase family protein [Gammaproteobacteria bacterium]
MTTITPEISLDAYAGKRILVTGSTGYLANNLIHMLKEVACQITRVARSGKILTLVEGKCNVLDIIGDLTTPGLWQQVLPHIDVVFHFAGQANIMQANQMPVEDIQHSIIPLLRLLDTCRQMQLKPHVVLASSVSLYGFPTSLPVDESCADKPQTIYDLHKLHCEEYLHYFIKQQHITGCNLRLSNVYGPGVHAGKFYNGLINHAIYCGMQREAIPIYGNGESTRDYLYLDDVSRAFLAAGFLTEKVNGQTYIISSSKSYSVNTVVEKILNGLSSIRGIHAETNTFEPTHHNQARDFRGTSAKFYQATGWEPQIDLEQGINLTIAAQ